MPLANDRIREKTWPRRNPRLCSSESKQVNLNLDENIGNQWQLRLLFGMSFRQKSPTLNLILENTIAIINKIVTFAKRFRIRPRK